MEERMSSSQNSESFLMSIEEVFTIKGSGTTVVGRVKSGTLRKGDSIQISGMNRPIILTTVTTFLGFIHNPDSYIAEAGDNCGILLREVQVEQLERGMVITKRDSP